jgi:hypothetical protein
VYVTKRNCALSLLAVYVNSALWAVSPLLGWGSYAPEPFGLSCTLDWARIPLSYTVSIFLFSYGLPLLLMLYCYGCIVASVRRATAHMRLLHTDMDSYITKVTHTGTCITKVTHTCTCITKVTHMHLHH